MDRPSDRDHLFMGEGEGYEEPLERDGTTWQSRGRKWYVVEVRCTRVAALRPDYSHGQNVMLEAPNGKSKPGNGLRGWEICRLGSLVIFGLSRVGWLPEYRAVFWWFWPVPALTKAERKRGRGLELERF
ncbi:hypothetical protein CDL15_Pgr010274 [Punica granatum]|uniref:Uncharacterized protein n=1 Tax=Punica granatum TaxID=22663 RepID=A0A218WJD5_PUNGR|nr:hypothetical protein CDL15_Pgr010274 [Punica granatum]